jgi:hypothetical protein
MRIVAAEVEALREKLAAIVPALRDTFTDSELQGMIEESREESPPESTLADHLANASRTARQVAAELSLLEPDPLHGG